MDDDLTRLAALVPVRSEPISTLDEGMSGSWRIRATKLTVRLDLSARTAIRLTDTVAGTTPDPLDGVELPLVRIESCTVGERLALEVRDDQGSTTRITARKVKYVQAVDADAERRWHGHLDRLRAAVTAGGDSPQDRRAALHFGAKWSAIGEVYGLSGVQAASTWQAEDRAELARLRAARGESATSS
ncbi:MAG: hypothetical protein ACRYF3_04280 [Janthinobacterium lividum]